MKTEIEAKVEVRRMRPNDAPAIVEFALALPPHDLLFLQRDIRNPRVIAAWMEQEDRGLIHTLLALSGGRVCGCAALVRDALSWSPHVGEIRVVVAPDMRGAGLGRRLAQDAFAQAITDRLEKLTVRLVPDQSAAIALFEEMGFRAEAMLRDHVRDSSGAKHDIAVLSLDVLRQSAQHRAFGFG
jgi:N-acetylglutamate synthase-like GNAT family acetyltransferase